MKVRIRAFGDNCDKEWIGTKIFLNIALKNDCYLVEQSYFDDSAYFDAMGEDMSRPIVFTYRPILIETDAPIVDSGALAEALDQFAERCCLNINKYAIRDRLDNRLFIDAVVDFRDDVDYSELLKLKEPVNSISYNEADGLGYEIDEHERFGFAIIDEKQRKEFDYDDCADVD